MTLPDNQAAVLSALLESAAAVFRPGRDKIEDLFEDWTEAERGVFLAEFQSWNGTGERTLEEIPEWKLMLFFAIKLKG